jgi:mono/diheme cytochrome c family protein
MSTRNYFTLLAVLLLVLLLAACSPNPQPAGLTAVPSLAPGATLTLVPAIQGGVSPVGAAGPAKGDPAEGAAVFMQNCTQCHGVNGQGGIGPALQNNSLIQAGNDVAVYTTIANGVSGSKMPAWLQANGGPFQPVQINNVVAYLHTLQGVVPIPSETPRPEEATETPLPPNAPTSEPARPSNGGNPGPAVSLIGNAKNGEPLFGKVCATCHGPQGVQGFPNPGSEDGSVPILNPIDSTIANADPKIFAANVDVFIEHGSVPDGQNPLVIMPAFGDGKAITPQQIADIIAYVLQLNGVKTSQ